MRLEASTYAAAELNAGKARVKVTTEITNSGTRPGEEVAQLYISLHGTSVARPVRELKGFQRVFLKPGQTRTVEFALARNELAFWNIEMENVVEPAELKIWVAGSSVAGTPAQLTIE